MTRSKPNCLTMRVKIACEVGLRQMFPVQTKSILITMFTERAAEDPAKMVPMLGILPQTVALDYIFFGGRPD